MGIGMLHMANISDQLMELPSLALGVHCDSTLLQLIKLSVTLIFNASLKLYHILDFELNVYKMDKKAKPELQYYQKVVAVSFCFKINSKCIKMKPKCMTQLEGGIKYQMYQHILNIVLREACT